MGRNASRRWTTPTLAALFLAGGAPVFGHQMHDHAPKGVDTTARKDREADPSTGGSRWGADYFPNVLLTTHEGKQVRFFDDVIKDKVVAINFMYTSCPDSCPLETARLVTVQKILGDRVGRDIFMYSITIDPERDTPEALKAYAEKFGVGPGWLFLTGKEEDVTLLRRKLGVYNEAVEENTSDHALSLVIGNQSTGRWAKRSPFENPYVLAEQLGSWLHNWKHGSVAAKRSYKDAPLRLRNLSRGESLFRTRCTACHTIGGGDVRDLARGNRGPDLLGVTDKRERSWLVRWLMDPEKMLAEKDPVALEIYAQYNNMLMPNFYFSERDAAALIEYMESESRRVEKERQTTAASSN